jgi:hypothetical protein
VINQKDVVTLMGTEESGGHGYAAKMWSGLLLGFYLPRWTEFFRRMKQAVDNSTALELDFSSKSGCTDASFCKWMNRFDEAWLRQDTRYAINPSGDAVAISAEIYSAYSHLLPGVAPAARPPPPPPAPIDGSKFVGCFTDGNGGKRDLPKLAGNPMPPASDPVKECASLCGKGYKYVGMQDGMQCLCGNKYGSQGRASSSCCAMGCAGNQSIFCGGNNCNSVWTNPLH